MTSILSILEEHELPWFEVQLRAEGCRDWTREFKHLSNRGHFQTSSQAFQALKTLLPVASYMQYRIYHPKTGDVHWQGRGS